jgi:hypothetical protein
MNDLHTKLRAQLKITHEILPYNALFIEGFHEPGAWMRIRIEGPKLAASAEISSNIRYQKTITGMEPVPFWATNLAWKMADEALNDLTAIPVVGRHELPPSRITASIALYLATKARVQEFGGLTGERENLARLLTALSSEEREVVLLREKGEVVL